MTNRHLEVMAWCLAKYFGHTEETATDAVERYYDTWKGIHDDDLYQHEGPYWMALREYFYQHCFTDEPDSN